MVDVRLICLLADCDRAAVMHVRHLDGAYQGECFCCWEHLCEYAHEAAIAACGSGHPRVVGSRRRTERALSRLRGSVPLRSQAARA